MSLTFMAKSERARGQLLPHPLLAARRRRRRRCMAGDGPDGLSPIVRALPRRAARRACASSPCSTRPNINSYKRYQPGSFAPTAVALGRRQPHLRAAAWSATAASLRVENRVPGGDVNPYLAVAAHGRRRRCTASSSELALEPACAGNAYTADAEHVPATLREAAELWERQRDRPRRRSATRSSRTTPTWRASSWPPSTPRSPTGSCSAASSGM